MAKATVARKSLGPKRPCGFDSRPGHKGQPGNEAWLFLLFWGWQQGFGTFTFAIYCYSNSYKSLGSQLALLYGGWELPVLQVRDNQSNTNKAVPNLGTPISGQHGLLIVLFAECGHGPKTPKDQTKSRQITKRHYSVFGKASFLGIKFFGKASILCLIFHRKAYLCCVNDVILC